MGPYRNNTAVQADVKLSRHNIRGSIFKNVNTSYTTQYRSSYESNYNKTPINNKAIIATVYTLTYASPTYNIFQPVIPNYAEVIQQPIQQFGLNYTIQSIHAAKKAGFIDRLEEYYTKCRLITIFQNKGNYLRLNEIDMVYFRVYYRSLVYEGESLKEALNLEMNELLSLIEMDGREIIVRLCEPYQLVRNDNLSFKIVSINFEHEMSSRDINPDKNTIKESISKVVGWLKKQINFASDEARDE